MAGRAREGPASRPARRRPADRRPAPARGRIRPAVRRFVPPQGGEAMIRRLATFAVAVTCLALAAGVAGAVTGTAKKSTGITIWVGWSKSTHEFGVFKSLIAEYNAKHPTVKVTAVSDINDDKIIAAIRSGSVPDVVSSFASSKVGSYCSSVGWINFRAVLKQSHIDAHN